MSRGASVGQPAVGSALLHVSEFGPFDLMAEWAHGYYVDGFSERAIQLCREGLLIAVPAADQQSVRYLHYIYGVSLNGLGRHPEAVVVARELLDCLDDSAGPYWRAKALALFAEAVTQNGAAGAGLNALAEAYSLVQGSLPRVYNHLSAAHAVAMALTPLQLFEPADELLVAAVRSKAGGELGELLSCQEAALLQGVWGAALTLLGRPAEAAKHYAICASRALRMRAVATRLGKAEMLARAEMIEGYACQRLGENDLAERRLRVAMAGYQLREELIETQLGRIALAMALTNRGEHIEARQHLAVATEAAQHSGRYVIEQFALAALAAVDEHESGPHPAVGQWRSIARSAMERLWVERGSRFESLHDRIRLRSLADESARMGREVMEDPLTGVGNRRLLDTALAVGATEAVSLVFIDVDRFKQVNDLYSHEVGDIVLRRLADILRAHCRADDLVIRYGGDEFVVLISSSSGDAHAVAQRIHAAVRSEPWESVASGLDVTVSLGVASEVLAEQVLANADAALYAAKRSGRDRVVVA